MQQQVKIRRLLDAHTAEVVCIRESACSGDCHKCSGCGAAQETLVFRADNPIGAKEGELVLIRSESAPILKAAAVLYLMPLALFFAGYLLGAALWQRGILTGGLGFALGIAGVVWYDRRVLQHRKTVYTITGYPSKQGIHTKGDEYLD